LTLGQLLLWDGSLFYLVWEQATPTDLNYVPSGGLHKFAQIVCFEMSVSVVLQYLNTAWKLELYPMMIRDHSYNLVWTWDWPTV